MYCDWVVFLANENGDMFFEWPYQDLKIAARK
jgi:hypothetical protein